MHKVVSIQLLANGEIITTAKRTDCMIKKNSQGHTIFSDQETTVTFRSRAIVLSNGGHQTLHPEFYKWFPMLEDKKENVVLADAFLRKDVYKQTMQKIKERKLNNIVIIGGSHSGFSCAWMLLNGPATYNKNTHVKTSYQDSFPGAILKTN